MASRDLLADVLALVWRELLAPWWPRIKDVLDSDIAHRSRALTDGGLGGVLADLHPKVRWTGGTVTIDMSAEVEQDLSGTGLVLMPGVFEWPDVGVSFASALPPTIDYPARGIAALWRAAGPSPSRTLVKFVGRTRGTLLAALEEPMSTTGLARHCGLPISTVSEQLRVLRDARLVETRRVGRGLRHTRSPLGTALLNGG